MNDTVTNSCNIETQMPNSGSKRGGWITFPFITGAVAGLTLASSGCMANLIVYLIQEFNIKSITAAQISNIVNGCIYMSPVLGAIIADSFSSSFSVISISSGISLLGTVLFTLTAAVDTLRPQPCTEELNICKTPSEVQYAVLYMGIALTAIGLGGTRFTIATMGANQLDKLEDQGIFFNWYFFTLYIASVVSFTGIVYIQDSVSWALGFGLCGAASLTGLAIFLLGYRFYHHDKPQESPFVDLARVFVAAIRKWKTQLSSRTEAYYGGHDGIALVVATTPGRNLRFFNSAALIVEGDIQPNGVIAKPWRLCTVQQVEDFKTVIRILPLWSTSIFLSTPIAIQSSLTVLQALSMDRHLGPHFKIPAGSIIVLVLISTSISLTFIDRVLYPAWQKLIGGSPTPLQRIGVGHVFNVLSMAVSALVESKRLNAAHNHHFQDQKNSIVPMLALWLCPQLVLVGIGEAFHFPGQVAFYYQQFPQSLRSTSTAMISLIIGISFNLSTALIDLVQRITGWLPDDINNGRIDNVYWMLVVVGVINFGYYLVCSGFYKYQNVKKGVYSSTVKNGDSS
ncbi:protein NRT1/ PTR FAMILY 2.7-like [Quillaja saponaria]|uniref:Protein NRT1/ PTR FAMILY 2.7-like n=1 Tax=Quillaja saponaria TaxID=32244 RepID=A0AAD7PA61_QUISA|nr:protein NRT1/ PTR FAMILY 2.7-like [Quillaja saponaria]